MCGRYITGSDEHTWAEWFEILNIQTPSRPEGRIQRAMRKVIVARIGPGDEPVHTSLVQWGLVPSFSKSERDGAKMINLRSETIVEKFGKIFQARRCVFPVEAWFISGTKNAGHGDVRVRSVAPFGLAGVWTRYRDTALESCAMLTTAANAPVARIHGRMPVMLDANGIRAWINGKSSIQNLKALCEPWPEADTLLE